MKTISTKTAIVAILSFAALCTAIVFVASNLPRPNQWDRYRTQYPEKAIKANLRQVVFAASDYMRRHRVNEVRYADMVGVSAFLDEPIEPVLGEDYNTICVTGQDTKIEVVTKDGRTISVTFNPLGTATAGPPMTPVLPPPDPNSH